MTSTALTAEQETHTQEQAISAAKLAYQQAVLDGDEIVTERKRAALNQLLTPVHDAAGNVIAGKEGVPYSQRLLQLEELKRTAPMLLTQKRDPVGDVFAALAREGQILPHIAPRYDVANNPSLADYTTADALLAEAIGQYRREYSDTSQTGRQERLAAMENRLSRLGAGKQVASALVGKIEMNCRPKLEK